MCGRYAFFSPGEAVVRLFGLLRPVEIAPRYNLAPMQWIPAVRADAAGGRSVVLLRWGLLPSWARDSSMASHMINARAETVGAKPAYRAAFRRRRCLVPADGWYEWQTTAGGRQPWFLHRRDGQPFGMAGLWERWVPQDGRADPVETCTIITTAATPGIAAIHDRMPVVIPSRACGIWLDAGTRDDAALEALLGANEEADWTAHRVSRRVNDARNDGPDLVTPVD